MSPTSRSRNGAGGGELPKEPAAGAPETVPVKPEAVDPADLLSKLDQVDRMIVKLKYENRGLSYAMIGKLLEPAISKQAVERRINDHGLKPVLAALEGDVIAAFRSHQASAVNVVARTMTGHNKSWLQYQAATYFLDGVKNSKLSLPDQPDVTDVIFSDPNAPKDLKK